MGNTLIVVEHDEDTMREADYLIDVGPGAGVFGGEIVAAGTPKQVARNSKSITGQYLSGKRAIPVPTERRVGNGRFIELTGAAENNLKEVTARFPAGQVHCCYWRFWIREVNLGQQYFEKRWRKS